MERLRKLRVNAKRKTPDSTTAKEIIALARELLPYTHLDAVDWDTQWDAEKRELRHNGIVVRLDD
jgi:hypothetical protein